MRHNELLLHLLLLFLEKTEISSLVISVASSRIRVLRLNPSTIAELHSYIKPPDEVSTVMRATFLLLGNSEKEIQVRSTDRPEQRPMYLFIQEWPQIQNLLGRFGKDSVRRRCYELNPLAIPVDKAREAKDILRNYDLIRVSEISVGLSAFYCWVGTHLSAPIIERYLSFALSRQRRWSKNEKNSWNHNGELFADESAIFYKYSE